MSDPRQELIDEATQTNHALVLLGRKIQGLQNEYVELMDAVEAVYRRMTPEEHMAFRAQYEHTRHP